MLQLYHRTINEVDICHYRDQLSFTLLKAASDLPYGTPVEKLIAEFQLKKNVSFCYVLQCKGDDYPLLYDSEDDDDTNTAYISVYQTEVKS